MSDDEIRYLLAAAVPDWVGLTHDETHDEPWLLATALLPVVRAIMDTAEVRGRAEVAQQLRDRHTRNGYGLCRECTTYGDDARDILQPVTWPCATHHFLAVDVS